MSAFREEDKDLFFGREVFVKQLVDGVQKYPLFSVIGASGSGKSSVVLAGLIPQLRKEGSWLVGSFRPQSQPFYEMASALVSVCYPKLEEDKQKEKVSKLFAQFKSIEFNRKLWQEITDILREHDDKRLLLVIDQFEELYALDTKERQQFIDALLEAIKYNPRLRLVLTIRHEFIDYIINYEPFKKVALQESSHEFLGAMVREDMKSVIELIDRDTQEKIVELEDGLTQRILDDVQQEPGNLPLLEFALAQLWNESGGSKGKVLTHQAYERIGGVRKALANHADDIYKQLDEKEKKQAQQIFLQLVRPGEKVKDSNAGDSVNATEEEKRQTHSSLIIKDTRRLATRNEIGEENWKLVKKLANVDQDIPNSEKKLPLLVTSRVRDEKTGQQTVEVVHEALIREWGELQGWIEEKRVFLAWRYQLQIQMNQWNMSKDEGYLLRGKALSDAEHFLQITKETLNKNEQNYIDESIDLRNREQEHKEQQKLNKLEYEVNLKTEQSRNQILTDANQKAKQRIKIGTFIGLLAATVFGISAKISFDKLQEAQSATKLEQQSNSIIKQFPNNQLQALLAAMQTGQRLKEMVESGRPIKNYPTIRPIFVLREILNNIQQQNEFDTGQKIVTSISFSPDSQSIATVGKDGTLRIWNLSGQEIRKIQAHDGSINGVNSVSFSPNGKTIATVGEDGKAKLWNLSGNLIIPALSEKEGGIKSVTFSPDGSKIATAGDYGIARIWDLNGKQIATLKGYKEINIRNITFSSDGKKIATAGDDGTVRLWDLSGKQLFQIIPHKGKRVFHVSFSPNGQFLVTAGEDNIARVWNLSGQEQKKLEGHQNTVLFASFSPDGKRLVTTSDDNTVRVWDFLSGQEIYKFQGHERAVLTASFSQNGKYLASAGKDGKTRIWNLSNRQITEITHFKGHEDDVNSLSFSPNNKLIASGDNDGIVRFWNFSGKQIGKELQVDDKKGKIFSVTFSPDGKYVATGGQEGKAKIWDLSGKLITQLNGRQTFVSSLSFSPDGNYIATTGADKLPKVWNRDGKEITTLEGHRDLVYQIKFHPKKQLIATGAWDGTIGLWNFDGHKANKISILEGHEEQIRSLSFSFDGKYFATADKGSKVKVWDISGKKQLEFLSYQSGINGLSFSPDGNYFATGGMDGTVKVWDLQGRQLAEFMLEKGSVWDVSFSRNGKSIIAGGDKGSLQSRKFKQLDELLSESCNWLKGYLDNHEKIRETQKIHCQ
ncbi:WD-40 repeat-containing protein (plasmid) [Calothrix sp. PCC 7716]|nr:WD-40 repeat-containing protein [Calothrix sp. PCC 7716]